MNLKRRRNIKFSYYFSIIFFKAQPLKIINFKIFLHAFTHCFSIFASIGVTFFDNNFFM